MSNQLKGSLLLLFTAMIWGSGFVAQKAGTTLPPLTYNGVRNILAALAMLPVIWAFSGRKEGYSPFTFDRATIKAGVACGLALCLGSNLQQAGLYFDTDAGKAGFITALYIVIVPLLGLFLHQQVRPVIWGCVLLAAGGFYLLTMAGKQADLSLQFGDLLVLLCAVGFAVHILTADHFVHGVDGIKVSCIQFFVTGVLSLLLVLFVETPTWSAVLDCWQPLLYASVVSSGIGYTCQLLGQQYADPAIASLLMSLESVFAVLCGVLFLGESMTTTELMGCAVIFVAVMIPQLPHKD